MKKLVRFSSKFLNKNNYTKNHKVAMIFAGCGHYDGTDVQEATGLLFNLSKHNFQVSYFAPTQEIEETFLYVPIKEVDKLEERYPHKEATRITNIPVQDLEKLKGSEYSAIIIPGGEGVLRVLGNYLSDLEGKFKVNGKLESLLKEFHKTKKPLLATSHGALLVGRVLGGITVTLGDNEDDLAQECRKWGNETVEIKHPQKIYQSENIITYPGNLLPSTTPSDIYNGTEKCADALIKLLE